MEVKIKIEEFEGPLDLLLHMIHDQKIDIYNIPIHHITREYLQYLSEANELSMELAAEFISMAALLLEIKSKMLLPDASLEPMSFENEEDPRYELMIKLIEYKKIKELSAYLSKEDQNLPQGVYTDQGQIYKNLASIEEEIREEFLEIDLLEEAFKRVLKKLNRFNDDKKEFFQNVYKEQYTVESKRSYIFEVLKEKKKLYFSELFPETAILEEVITTFLALLEIVRDRHISILQKDQFGEILLTRRSA